MTFYPVYQPQLNGNESKYVNDCLNTGWISSKGEYVKKFEAAFASYTGAKHASTVANGTVALHLALVALDLQPGDEVIVPTFTYIASINTILQTGAVPVFVDSLVDTWQVDPADILRKITNKTKAVMAVHLYGLTCDMAPIQKICKDHQLLLIEDCAEAFGSLYHGQHAGTFGDISTFSFFGNKTITTGEGGMVITNNSKLDERVNHLKNQGVSSSREYWHDTLAFNYRMTNICAAIGLAQLERAETIIQKKRDLAKMYQEKLQGLPLTFHPEPKGYFHTYWMCSIALHQTDLRQPLRQHLKENGVDTRPTFPLAHLMPHCAKSGSFPGAEKLSSGGINLPSYPDLQEKDIDYITGIIATFMNSRS